MARLRSDIRPKVTIEIGTHVAFVYGAGEVDGSASSEINSLDYDSFGD